jgi:hypothetical protein
MSTEKVVRSKYCPFTEFMTLEECRESLIFDMIVDEQFEREKIPIDAPYFVLFQNNPDVVARALVRQIILRRKK